MTRAAETYETVGEQLEHAFSRVREVAEQRKVAERLAAQAVAVEELIATMRDRGWIPG
jgi:glutamate dehydrogenase/leucine dehydrogenase